MWILLITTLHCALSLGHYTLHSSSIFVLNLCKYLNILKRRTVFSFILIYSNVKGFISLVKKSKKKLLTSSPLKMQPKDCPETSVNYY
jgi:hypothetical protein